MERRGRGRGGGKGKKEEEGRRREEGRGKKEGEGEKRLGEVFGTQMPLAMDTPMSQTAGWVVGSG